MKAKIVMSNGEKIEFNSVEEAQKYAQFDQTTYPCEVVAEDGTVVSSYSADDVDEFDN